jgi:hypothetical protein
MPRNSLPRVMKHYCLTDRRSRGRTLKRLLDTWDRNGPTSGPTPWQICDDDILCYKPYLWCFREGKIETKQNNYIILGEKRLIFYNLSSPWFGPSLTTILQRCKLPYISLLKYRKQHNQIHNFYGETPNCLQRHSPDIGSGIIYSYFLFLIIWCSIIMTREGRHTYGIYWRHLTRFSLKVKYFLFSFLIS